MIFKIKNTSGDRTKVTQHRSAAGFSPEPTIGGARLRVGQHMFVEEAHFARIRDSLYKSFQDGAIEVEQVEGLPEGHQFGVPYDSPRPESNPHEVSGAPIETKPMEGKPAEGDQTAADTLQPKEGEKTQEVAPPPPPEQPPAPPEQPPSEDQHAEHGKRSKKR